MKKKKKNQRDKFNFTPKWLLWKKKKWEDIPWKKIVHEGLEGLECTTGQPVGEKTLQKQQQQQQVVENSQVSGHPKNSARCRKYLQFPQLPQWG